VTEKDGGRLMAATQMHELQEDAHGEGFDYIAGSPHLKHPYLASWMRLVLAESVGELCDKIGRVPRVLEVGAGHGSFTETLASVGADVVVTEMSEPSAQLLAKRFRNNKGVQVVLDRTGDVSSIGEVDMVVYMSVLHHIPDYLGSVRATAKMVREGGTLISFQDPLYYPRRSRASLLLDKSSYYLWRTSRGDYLRGLKTITRRVREQIDEANPADMSEYHVVRQGVDEQALAALLRGQFGAVEVTRYWSTQAGWMQAVGSRLRLPNTFALVAKHRCARS
jgi:SAM-dependent methyltransferase